jgi:hypothetical protein
MNFEQAMRAAWTRYFTNKTRMTPERAAVIYDDEVDALLAKYSLS